MPGRNVTTLQGSGLNVTMDNYFTGVPLAKTMLQRKLTIVGTMKKWKREIPECMKPAKSLETKTSIFCFNDQLTMVIGQLRPPQKNKAVILLSTMHHEISIDEEDHKKRDQKTSSFTTRGRSVLTKLIKWLERILAEDKFDDGRWNSSSTC